MPICFDLTQYSNDYFVETGTHEGNGLRTALDSGAFKVLHSIENRASYFVSAERSFAREIAAKKLFLHLGDSAACLAAIIADIQTPITFWLDAHWPACPLMRELEAIRNHPIKSHTVLIDDRRLFGRRRHRTWGQHLSEKSVVDALRSINSDYRIELLPGIIADDVIAARVPNARMSGNPQSHESSAGLIADAGQ